MTANQISFAAQQETERHNRVTEQLQERANDINAEHLSRMDDINSRYNDTFLALQQAQGDEKLRLQHELNGIEQQKALITQEYNARVNALREDELSLKNRSQDWLQTYQDQMIKMGFGELYAKMYATQVQEKKTEYDHQYQEDLIRIQDYNALANFTHISNQYELGKMQNYINMQLATSQKNLMDNQAAAALSGAIFNGVQSIGSIMNPLNLLWNNPFGNNLPKTKARR